jgi:hypothetical protein
MTLIIGIESTWKLQSRAGSRLGADSQHEDLFRRQAPYRRHPDLARDRRFADSPLEEAGFELAVPRRIVTLIPVFAYVTPST